MNLQVNTSSLLSSYLGRVEFKKKCAKRFSPTNFKPAALPDQIEIS